MKCFIDEWHKNKNLCYIRKHRIREKLLPLQQITNKNETINIIMETNETKGFYKLSWLQRIGFGAGDLAQNLIYQTICMYLLFFYTDVYILKIVIWLV